MREREREGLPGVMFLVGEQDQEPEDVWNEEVNVVEMRLFDALQLLRHEVYKHLQQQQQQQQHVESIKMITLESRCIPVVLGGVIILRTLPNH